MRVCGILLLFIVLSGCMTRRDLAVVPPRPDGPHYAAIYAAGFIEPPRDRASVLCSLAARQDLTAGEQIYLIDVLVASGGTSNQNAAVLLELIHNPTVNNFTRAKIADAIPYLELLPRHAEEVGATMAYQR